MLAALALAAGAALAPLSQEEPAAGLALDYVLSVPDPGRAVVDAELHVRGLGGAVELSLPRGHSYVTLAEPRLAGPVTARAEDGRELALERRAPYRWRLEPGDARGATLAWRVPLDHRALPAVVGRDEYEQPYLAADHGLLVSAVLAIAPEAEPAAIRVRVVPPAGWPVFAPWPELEPGLFEPPDRAALQDDLLALGAWDVERARVGDMELLVAVAPGQEPLRALAAERVPAIVAAELELFGCTPQPHYAFFFVAPQPGGLGGSPKTSSMTLYVAPELPLDLAAPALEHLVAHEFHHTWGRARFDLPDELRFFVEGFTDWYAYLVPWRLGTHSDAQLVATIEEKLALLERSLAAAGCPLVEAGGERFFAGGAPYDATYAGGLVLACLTDLALRARGEEGNDLDALMRAFHEDPRWRAGARPALADLLALVERRAGEEHAALLRSLLERSGAPDLVAAFERVGVELARREEPAPLDLRANFDGTRLLAADPNDACARIGLQPGDRLLEVNGAAVADEAGVRAAWAAPREGRIVVVLAREGAAEPIALDVARPRRVVYTLPAGFARRLRG